MLAALADVVHDRQRADSHEHNRDEDNDYGAFHSGLAPPGRRAYLSTVCDKRQPNRF